MPPDEIPPVRKRRKAKDPNRPRIDAGEAVDILAAAGRLGVTAAAALSDGRVTGREVERARQDVQRLLAVIEAARED